jgi:hypothetical protein
MQKIDAFFCTKFVVRRLHEQGIVAERFCNGLLPTTAYLNVRKLIPKQIS